MCISPDDKRRAEESPHSLVPAAPCPDVEELPGPASPRTGSAVLLRLLSRGDAGAGAGSVLTGRRSCPSPLS